MARIARAVLKELLPSGTKVRVIVPAPGQRLENGGRGVKFELGENGQLMMRSLNGHMAAKSGGNPLFSPVKSIEVSNQESIVLTRYHVVENSDGRIGSTTVVFFPDAIRRR